MNDMSVQKIDSLYAMFTGTPGTRKSTQALTFPKPMYFFSWDQKMQALQLPIRHWGIDPKLIKFDDYDDWESARKKLEEFEVTCPFRTIVIDSITSMANYSLRQVKESKIGTTHGKSIGGIMVNSVEDYNAESAALLELVALTKAIKKVHKVNVILIAHLIQAEYKSATNTQANMVRTIVTAGKRIAPQIPAYVDEAYHFFIEQGVSVNDSNYSILTTATTDDFARTALPIKSKLQLNNQPLYDTYLKPAIDNLNQTIPSMEVKK